ncbi:MAG: hypothetical protein JNK04_21160 [Myxococcales bacterium]|nr:hypothetical protein [Myxococcales bacterium]
MRALPPGLALWTLLALGCEGMTRVDCPALELEQCLANRGSCLWAGFENNGDCRNTCELEDADCEDGLSCKDTGYYDPDKLEEFNVRAPLCSPD